MKTPNQQTSAVDSKNGQYGGTILGFILGLGVGLGICLLYTSPSPRD